MRVDAVGARKQDEGCWTFASRSSQRPAAEAPAAPVRLGAWRPEPVAAGGGQLADPQPHPRPLLPPGSLLRSDVNRQHRRFPSQRAGPSVLLHGPRGNGHVRASGARRAERRGDGGSRGSDPPPARWALPRACPSVPGTMATAACVGAVFQLSLTL